MNTTLKLISIATIGALTGLVAANASAANYSVFTPAAITCDIQEAIASTARFDESAKIGIARIDNGRLISMSVGEEKDWDYLNDRTAQKYERISVAAHLKTLPDIDMDGRDTNNQIDEIRLTASDLGMKYVMIYGMGRDAGFGSFGRKTMMRTGLVVNEHTASPAAPAKGLLVETYSGKVLGTVTASEVEFGVGELTEKVEDLVNDLTGKPRRFNT